VKAKINGCGDNGVENYDKGDRKKGGGYLREGKKRTGTIRFHGRGNLE